MPRTHADDGEESDMLAEIDALPEEERAAVDARAEELHRQACALRDLRALTDRSQKEVAEALGIKQPSVSKMEAQADMYLSTLRSYIEALGGSLKLKIDLPEHGTIELDDLADLSDRQRGYVDPKPAAMTAPEAAQEAVQNAAQELVGQVVFYDRAVSTPLHDAMRGMEYTIIKNIDVLLSDDENKTSGFERPPRGPHNAKRRDKKPEPGG